MKNRKALLPILLIVLIVISFIISKEVLNSTNNAIEENGKLSVQSVVEQIAQTYKQQVESYYSRLRVIDNYAAQGNKDIIENNDIKNFLISWQNETGATLYFIKDNGVSIDINKNEKRLEITSSLLKDLREKQNISKLITYNDGENSQQVGFLMVIPCDEYYIDDEAYSAIGALVDRNKLDSLLKLYAYNGQAYLFMLDKDGDVTYTNQEDEKIFQNYSLLKHLKSANALSDDELNRLNEAFKNKAQGVELLGDESNAYYLGYYPIGNSNSTLVCIVARGIVNNTLSSYQETILYSTIAMAAIILLLFAALFYAISKANFANQKAIWEKQNFDQQQLYLNELESINGELKQAQEVTSQALQAAESANKAKTDFLSNMSHDIRTPMNAIIGMTSLIKHDANNEEKVKEYVDKIELSSKNLLGIINDVLDMNKIESGKTTLNHADFSIIELIDEIETVFAPQAKERKQTLKIVRKHIKHEWLNGDNVRLTQVLNNLLSNAIKYTQNGGKIEFAIEELSKNSDSYAKYHFYVKDNGIGIDKDFQEKIFDAFTREESSLTNKIQGTGLGMAIAKNLVDLMGGTITVNSEKGKGSCFDILLDFKLTENQELATKQEANEETKEDKTLKGMKFLCAEDNNLNAEILKELLKMEGAKCTICDNGQKIVDTFKKAKPGDFDIILMDVQMPIMNGYEATKAIREFNKDIPIIAMTANAFSEDIQASLDAGMNAHVSKPVDMKAVKKTIKNL